MVVVEAVVIEVVLSAAASVSVVVVEIAAKACRTLFSGNSTHNALNNADLKCNLQTSVCFIDVLVLLPNPLHFPT